mmetsp:Transcript_77607/g.251269  ORF Transcript_77607/g.251269 Transcript_77607/m.251269 type:complete len:320 (-) Transcript_77607:116-1075(-)
MPIGVFVAAVRCLGGSRDAGGAACPGAGSFGLVQAGRCNGHGIRSGRPAGALRVCGLRCRQSACWRRRLPAVLRGRVRPQRRGARVLRGSPRLGRAREGEAGAAEDDSSRGDGSTQSIETRQPCFCRRRGVGTGIRAERLGQPHPGSAARLQQADDEQRRPDEREQGQRRGGRRRRQQRTLLGAAAARGACRCESGKATRRWELPLPQHGLRLGRRKRLDTQSCNLHVHGTEPGLVHRGHTLDRVDSDVGRQRGQHLRSQDGQRRAVGRGPRDRLLRASEEGEHPRVRGAKEGSVRAHGSVRRLREPHHLGALRRRCAL